MKMGFILIWIMVQVQEEWGNKISWSKRLGRLKFDTDSNEEESKKDIEHYFQGTMGHVNNGRFSDDIETNRRYYDDSENKRLNIKLHKSTRNQHGRKRNRAGVISKTRKYILLGDEPAFKAFIRVVTEKSKNEQRESKNTYKFHECVLPEIVADEENINVSRSRNLKGKKRHGKASELQGVNIKRRGKKKQNVKYPIVRNEDESKGSQKDNCDDYDRLDSNFRPVIPRVRDMLLKTSCEPSNPTIPMSYDVHLEENEKNVDSEQFMNKFLNTLSRGCHKHSTEKKSSPKETMLEKEKLATNNYEKISLSLDSVTHIPKLLESLVNEIHIDKTLGLREFLKTVTSPQNQCEDANSIERPRNQKSVEKIRSQLCNLVTTKISLNGKESELIEGATESNLFEIMSKIATEEAILHLMSSIFGDRILAHTPSTNAMREEGKTTARLSVTEMTYIIPKSVSISAGQQESTRTTPTRKNEQTARIDSTICENQSASGASFMEPTLNPIDFIKFYLTYTPQLDHKDTTFNKIPLDSSYRHSFATNNKTNSTLNRVKSSVNDTLSNLSSLSIVDLIKFYIAYADSIKGDHRRKNIDEFFWKSFSISTTTTIQETQSPNEGPHSDTPSNLLTMDIMDILNVYMAQPRRTKPGSAETDTDGLLATSSPTYLTTASNVTQTKMTESNQFMKSTTSNPAISPSALEFLMKLYLAHATATTPNRKELSSEEIYPTPIPINNYLFSNALTKDSEITNAVYSTILKLQNDARKSLSAMKYTTRSSSKTTTVAMKGEKNQREGKSVSPIDNKQGSGKLSIHVSCEVCDSGNTSNAGDKECLNKTTTIAESNNQDIHWQGGQNITPDVQRITCALTAAGGVAGVSTSATKNDKNNRNERIDTERPSTSTPTNHEHPTNPSSGKTTRTEKTFKTRNKKSTTPMVSIITNSEYCDGSTMELAANIKSTTSNIIKITKTITTESDYEDCVSPLSDNFQSTSNKPTKKIQTNIGDYTTKISETTSNQVLTSASDTTSAISISSKNGSSTFVGTTVEARTSTTSRPNDNNSVTAIIINENSYSVDIVKEGVAFLNSSTEKKPQINITFIVNKRQDKLGSKEKTDDEYSDEQWVPNNFPSKNRQVCNSDSSVICAGKGKISKIIDVLENDNEDLITPGIEKGANIFERDEQLVTKCKAKIDDNIIAGVVDSLGGNTCKCMGCGCGKNEAGTELPSTTSEATDSRLNTQTTEPIKGEMTPSQACDTNKLSTGKKGFWSRILSQTKKNVPVAELSTSSEERLTKTMACEDGTKVASTITEQYTATVSPCSTEQTHHNKDVGQGVSVTQSEASSIVQTAVAKASENETELIVNAQLIEQPEAISTMRIQTGGDPIKSAVKSSRTRTDYENNQLNIIKNVSEESYDKTVKDQTLAANIHTEINVYVTTKCKDEENRTESQSVSFENFKHTEASSTNSGTTIETAKETRPETGSSTITNFIKGIKISTGPSVDSDEKVIIEKDGKVLVFTVCMCPVTTCYDIAPRKSQSKEAFQKSLCASRPVMRVGYKFDRVKTPFLPALNGKEEDVLPLSYIILPQLVPQTEPWSLTGFNGRDQLINENQAPYTNYRIISHDSLPFPKIAVHSVASPKGFFKNKKEFYKNKLPSKILYPKYEWSKQKFYGKNYKPINYGTLNMLLSQPGSSYMNNINEVLSVNNTLYQEKQKLSALRYLINKMLRQKERERIARSQDENSKGFEKDLLVSLYSSLRNLRIDNHVEGKGPFISHSVSVNKGCPYHMAENDHQMLNAISRHLKSNKPTRNKYIPANLKSVLMATNDTNLHESVGNILYSNYENR